MENLTLMPREENRKVENLELNVEGRSDMILARML